MRTHFFTKSLFIAALLLILSLHIYGQAFSDFITIDQFGYRPDARKTAVIKNPQQGSDKDKTLNPGNVYKVIHAETKESVFQGQPVLFDNGNTDAASGDKIWWFDFSAVTTPGNYYILDASNNLRSYVFSIQEDVYNDVLKHAMRMFFYQRAGCEKEARYAGEGWADGASHVGPLQDKNCRLYNKKNDASTERDLHGGWYDAGDYNKYTAWAANYVESLLLIYQENPDAFTDDYNIPESGNGIPDILDEAKWGMDWLLRMQNPDGSSLSLVGLSHTFPPSAAKEQSLYGPANTVATITSAKAFALGVKVFDEAGLKDYSAQLKEAALKAWKWADENPKVVFHNNDKDSGTLGLGAGDQEVSDTDDVNTRLGYKVAAGLYLYELTGKEAYLKIFEDNYKNFQLFRWSNHMGQYWHKQYLTYFRYLAAPYGKENIKSDIRKAMITAFNKAGDYAGNVDKDGYRSFIKDYNWGSNQYKSEYGHTFYLWALLDMEPSKSEGYYDVAEDYLHYIHGVNPFNMVYLTNMNNYGASKSLTEIYHSWFDHYSSKWDKVGVTTYGPAPGYLAGGANEDYKWDGCCDSKSCGSTDNNAICLSEPIPVGEPSAKMYKDFNTSWPLNSWALSEPSNGYQVAYIRLLSKFVSPKGGSSTGISRHKDKDSAFKLLPNPVKRGEKLVLKPDTNGDPLQVIAYNMKGETVLMQTFGVEEVSLDTSTLVEGVYVVKGYQGKREVFVQKVQVL